VCRSFVRWPRHTECACYRNAYRQAPLRAGICGKPALSPSRIEASILAGSSGALGRPLQWALRNGVFVTGSRVLPGSRGITPNSLPQRSVRQPSVFGWGIARARYRKTACPGLFYVDGSKRPRFGVKAINRWLSATIPPDLCHDNGSTPTGVAARYTRTKLCPNASQ
jgi:hypothetical protein